MNNLNNNNWFLIEFKPNKYETALKNLNNQGVKTFTPFYNSTYRRKTKFLCSKKQLFPGYMFVSFNTDLLSWRKIGNTFGVKRVVFFGDSPKPLNKELMSALISKCDSFGILPNFDKISKGDEIKLKQGPFANFLAKVDKVDTNGRIWLFLEHMGNLTKITINKCTEKNVI